MDEAVTPEAEKAIAEALTDPAIMVKALRGASDEVAISTLKHFRDLIRTDAMMEATTGYKSLASTPETQAQLLWLQLARDIYDTISVLPREEALCLLAARIKTASAYMGLSYRDQATDKMAALLSPGVAERPALDTLATRLLASLDGPQSDEIERRELVLIALVAARRMQPEEEPGRPSPYL